MIDGSINVGPEESENYDDNDIKNLELKSSG